MIQLHATRKLFEQLPLNEQGCFAQTPFTKILSERPPLDINPLSGWHGNLVKIQRRNVLLLMHDATRFSLAIPCITKKDFKNFDDLFLDILATTLLKCDANDQQMKVLSQCQRSLQVDDKTNRSVLGSMNRSKFAIECKLAYDEMNVEDLSPRVWVRGYQKEYARLKVLVTHSLKKKC